MLSSEPHRFSAATTRICPSFLTDSALSGFRSRQTDISPSDSPAVILEVNSEPLAFMRFFEDAGSTLAILDCWFVVEIPREEFRLRIGQLLQGAIDAARQRKCRMVRVLNTADPRLLPHRSSPWPVQDLGFVHRATVSKWRPVETHVALCRRNNSDSSLVGENLTERPDQGDSVLSRTTRQLDHIQLGDSNDEGPTQARIQHLLNLIRRDSNDLIRLPKLDADELVVNWRQKQSHVVIASLNDKDAGLIAWSTSHTHGLAEVAIDFLGVSSDFRRQGIGRRLILRSLSEIAERHDGHILDVSVMIDSNNAAAVQLYHHAGFRRTPIAFDVWILELDM